MKKEIYVFECSWCRAIKMNSQPYPSTLTCIGQDSLQPHEVNSMFLIGKIEVELER